MRQGMAGQPGARQSPGAWSGAASVARGLCRQGAAVCALVVLMASAAPAPGVVRAAVVRAPSAPRSCGRVTNALRAAQSAASAYAATPSLTLSPAHGAAGTKIVATGAGWPPGAAVSISAQERGQGVVSQPSASTTVLSDGSFALTVAAPQATCYFTPVLGQVIQFVATSAGSSVTASAEFSYDTPVPTLTAPAEGGHVAPTATTLPIRGSNWGAGTVVTVWATTPSTPGNPLDAWLPPSGMPIAVLTADAAGQIIGEVPVLPALLPLRPGVALGLAASASGRGYGQLISFLPGAYHVALAARPTLVASRLTLAQGESLHVTGDHWWPGDAPRVLLCQGAQLLAAVPGGRCNPARSETLGTVQVDASGHFAANITVPANAPTGAGTLEVSVSGEPDDPFTATQAVRVSANASVGAWLADALGPAAPLVALALLALAAALAAIWWMARVRATGGAVRADGRR